MGVSQYLVTYNGLMLPYSTSFKIQLLSCFSQSSSFCSMTLKKLHEATHFSLCNDNNTVV